MLHLSISRAGSSPKPAARKGRFGGGTISRSRRLITLCDHSEARPGGDVPRHPGARGGVRDSVPADARQRWAGCPLGVVLEARDATRNIKTPPAEASRRTGARPRAPPLALLASLMARLPTLDTGGMLHPWQSYSYRPFVFLSFFRDIKGLREKSHIDNAIDILTLLWDIALSLRGKTANNAKNVKISTMTHKEPR